jgi:putative glutamine amidotransferase
MRPRIALPMPHSADREYSARAIPQYERAIELAGGLPVGIALDQTAAALKKIAETCDAVLLPGSKADVDPNKFGAQRSSHTSSADPLRENVDAILLEEAYGRRKPVLGICYGLQSLNVYRGGSLVQHIPDFLPVEKRGLVNHEAGKAVEIAHKVEIAPNSRVAEIVESHDEIPSELQTGRHGYAVSGVDMDEQNRRMLASNGKLVIGVNSSHHQSAEKIGEGLRVTALCVEDGIIEAIERNSPDHFVVAVQWHPERSVDKDAASRALFSALIQAARSRAE